MKRKRKKKKKKKSKKKNPTKIYKYKFEHINKSYNLMVHVKCDDELLNGFLRDSKGNYVKLDDIRKLKIDKHLSKVLEMKLVNPQSKVQKNFFPILSINFEKMKSVNLIRQTKRKCNDNNNNGNGNNNNSDSEDDVDVDVDRGGGGEMEMEMGLSMNNFDKSLYQPKVCVPSDMSDEKRLKIIKEHISRFENRIFYLPLTVTIAIENIFSLRYDQIDEITKDESLKCLENIIPYLF